MASGGAILAQEQTRSIDSVAAGERTMSDLIYVGAVVAFFVVSAIYVRFCGHL
jgi:hypothetical protein